jgi:hypothetical protein
VLVPGKEVHDKYGTAVIKTVAINSGVWDENGWVDVQVTIPGTVPVLAAGPNRAPRLVDGPRFDPAGRQVEKKTPGENKQKIRGIYFWRNQSADF